MINTLNAEIHRPRRVPCWYAYIDGEFMMLIEIKPHKNSRWFVNLRKKFTDRIDQIAFFTTSPNVDTVKVSFYAANVYKLDGQPQVPVFYYTGEHFFKTTPVVQDNEDGLQSIRLQLTDEVANVLVEDLPF